MNNPEIITLIVGGFAYTAWKSMSVKYTARSPEISFEITAADEAPDLLSAAWIFEPGTPCQLLANGSLLVDGYINDLEPSIGPNEHTIRVAGRSKSQDCVDCTIEHGSYEWKNKDLKQILNDTGNNTVFNTDETLKKFPVKRANVGQTVFNFGDRIARTEGMYLTGQRDGTVMITKHGKKQHAFAIVEGVNLISGNSKFSDRQRHEKYKVKGQTPTGTGKDATQVDKEEKDSGAREGRIRHFTPDQNLPKDKAEEEAKRIKKERQGNSVRATVTVQGFRDDGGTIWTAGWLIFVQSTMLRLADNLAIDEAELKQDASGSFATLSLVDPRALGGEKKGKSRSSGGYSKGL